MKTIQTLQNESDRISNIAEKRAFEFVLKYLLTLNRQISVVARTQSINEATNKVNSINGVKELYSQIYNKSGWYYAQLQHTQLLNQKRMNISFFSTIWKAFMNKQLGSTEMVKRIVDVTENIKEKFRELLLTANKNNYSTQQTAKLFQDNISVSRVRALRIARTEMTHASALGAEFATETIEGLELYAVWIHSKVGNYRETHAAVNGKYVKKGEDFNVGGVKMKYPGDPRGGASEVVNCRCRVSYLTKEALQSFNLWKK